MAAPGRRTAAAAISSAAAVREAMGAPAVAVSPAGPGAHAEEDAVVEVARAVEAAGGAGVGSVVVVAPGANGLHPDADHYLSIGCRREGEGGEQSRAGDE